MILRGRSGRDGETSQSKSQRMEVPHRRGGSHCEEGSIPIVRPGGPGWRGSYERLDGCYLAQYIHTAPSIKLPPVPGRKSLLVPAIDTGAVLSSASAQALRQSRRAPLAKMSQIEESRPEARAQRGRPGISPDTWTNLPGLDVLGRYPGRVALDFRKPRDRSALKPGGARVWV